MIRIFDILLACIGLLALGPILILLVLVLRVTGEGEVIYKQTRVGKHGAHFSLLKFATMQKNSPNIGSGEITIKNDPRVLPVGRFLRKSKLNELPQLLNILVGDLSLVGPRPLVPNTFLQYDAQVQLALNSVSPGLTGVGSIFFRDEEKWLDSKEDPGEFYREVIAPYKGQLEVWYVNNRSIWLYWKIIFATAWIVIFPSSTLHERFLADLPPAPGGLLTKSC